MSYSVPRPAPRATTMYESSSSTPVPAPRPKSEAFSPPRRTLPPPPVPSIPDTTSSAPAPPRRPIPNAPEQSPTHKLAVPPKRTLPPPPTPPTTPPSSASDAPRRSTSSVPAARTTTATTTAPDRSMPSPPLAASRPSPAPRPASTYSLGRATSRPPSVASLTLPERPESPPPMPKLAVPPRRPVSLVPSAHTTTTETAPETSEDSVPELVKRPFSSVRAMAESLEAPVPGTEPPGRGLPSSAIKVMLDPTDRSPPIRPVPAPGAPPPTPPTRQRSTTVPWKQKALEAKALEPIPEPILTPTRRVPPPPPRSSTLPWKTKVEPSEPPTPKPAPAPLPARMPPPVHAPLVPVTEEPQQTEPSAPAKPRRFPTVPLPRAEPVVQPPALPSRPALPARPSAPVHERQPSPERPSLPARPGLPQRPALPQTQRPPALPKTERPPLPQSDRPSLPQRPTLPARSQTVPALLPSSTDDPEAYVALKKHAPAVTREFNGERLDLKHVDFSYIDEHARACPPSEEESIARLSYYLTSPFPGDQVAQLRSIFAWICFNITYDFHAAYGGGVRGDQRAEGVLRSKTSVCEGYSNLFFALSEQQGLGVSKVNGDAKGMGYKQESGKLGEGHAWNRVTINGEHLLIDSTWGGAMNNVPGQEIKAISEKKIINGYFLARPHRMIYTHWPTNKNDQCLDPPLPETIYRQLPTRKIGSWAAGVNLYGYSFNHSLYTDDDYFEVQLRAKKLPWAIAPSRLCVKLKWNSEEKPVSAIWTKEDEKYHYLTVKTFCPSAGAGELMVYGGPYDPNTENQRFDNIASIRVVNSGTGANYGEPITPYGAPGFTHSIAEPIKGPLQAGVPQKVCVHIYHVQDGVARPSQLMFYNAEDLPVMRRDGTCGRPEDVIPQTGPYTYETERAFHPGKYCISVWTGQSFVFLGAFEVV
ncbi:hypothetical protein EMPS_04464 [Entomortierella parvispora]|uniref:Transglutaminase-like domain-containing protein n=1 Tax=Entomortierella parvispora TaxID=205924 RepID=A0A9P3H9A9_9FUNG|nr:hypothetical protein EMPS_04464 [Entomortierella parvispora]